jgi:hypothetical protein
MKLDITAQNCHINFYAVDIRLKVSGEPEHIQLISRLQKPTPVVPETPGTEGVPDSEEEVYQAAVFLQKIIKGCAIQTLVCIMMNCSLYAWLILL